MDIDAWVIQPALNPTLDALGKFSTTGHISNPFGEVDAACMNYGNHKSDTGGQMTQVCPIPQLTDSVVQGTIEGTVFNHSGK
ncbi:MAG: hypothetical protein ACKO24_18245 [Leptolyngbyaceae cyanobacterium]